MANGRVNRQAAWLAGFFAMLVLGFTFAGASRAQTQSTTTVDVRNFEVIAVDGNHLVLRDERGTNEYTVPGDFVFMVDGKKMTVADLKAGMKGKATVTTTTTIVPVVVTELRSGVVLSIGMNSVTVLDRSDGVRKKFTRDQLNARGIQVFKDGRVIPISELNKGDDIVATIVSQRAPDVVTEQEVQATLAQPEVKTETPATKSESTPAKTEPVSVAAPPTPAVATQPTAAAPAPAEGLGNAWYVLIAVVIAAVLFLFRRRRNDGRPSS